jgi:hypothetical protein
MSTHKFALAFAATAALAISTLVPTGASAFGHGNQPPAPAKTVSSPKYGYGSGHYGWCYWHPYRCYYRTH